MQLHCLYVGHFAGNLGDSAMFEALESLLPPGWTLTCEAHQIRPWPGGHTRLIPHEDRHACDEALAAADAALIPGTTIVTDLHGGEWPIVPILERCWRAYELGRPIHAVGVGLYPMAAWQRRRIASELIPLVDSFSVRDAASRDVLLAAGAAAERVTLAADLAFLLPSPVRGAAAPVVAVNVVHEDWRQCGDFYDGVAQELDAFAAESGCRLRLMCNEIREGEMFDGAAARALAGRLRGAAELSPPAWRAPREVIAELAGCELAVSMRYHFSIFAALAGTPWIGFARGGKMRALCEEFEAPAAARMGSISGVREGAGSGAHGGAMAGPQAGAMAGPQVGLAPVLEMGKPPGGRLLSALREAWAQRVERRAEQERVTARLRERAGRCGEVLRGALAREGLVRQAPALDGQTEDGMSGEAPVCEGQMREAPASDAQLRESPNYEVQTHDVLAGEPPVRDAQTRAGLAGEARVRRMHRGSRAWDLARGGEFIGGPPFLRCTSEEGITPAEGPYPQFDLPVVRWGLGPQSVLRFASSGGAAVLCIEARRNDDPHQAIELSLNGRLVARHQFGPEAVFHELRLPVRTVAGENELRMEYQSWGSKDDPRELAVLFRRIQITAG
ncbi:MAG: polysaccharide pyruvyl transferase family protein [Phycisphaerales bacterium]|nr:polysaccharide pyruvyl transferase family protein [Phycisphaerales bacterium]